MPQRSSFSVLFQISPHFPKRPSKGLFHDLHREFLLALTVYAYVKSVQKSKKASEKVSKWVNSIIWVYSCQSTTIFQQLYKRDSCGTIGMAAHHGGQTRGTEAGPPWVLVSRQHSDSSESHSPSRCSLGALPRLLGALTAPMLHEGTPLGSL